MFNKILVKFAFSDNFSRKKLMISRKILYFLFVVPLG